MPHWAELDDNDVVLRVIVCDADDGADGTKHPPKFCTEVLGGRWARTYYNTPGKSFAGPGYKHLGNAQFEGPPASQPPDPAGVLAADPEFQKLPAATQAAVVKFAGRFLRPPTG